MNPRLPLLRLALGVVLSLPAVGLMAQCTNNSSYPSNAIVPDPLGAVTTISTCSYLQEYSTVGSVISGATYQFTCTGSAYITVRSGTYDGPVVGSGSTPLAVTTTSTDNLFAHWNTNAQCGTSTGCQTSTVQLFLNCVPPSATVTPIDDCDNNQFSLAVNVTGVGDGTSVDLIYTLNGGADQTLAGQLVGNYNLGPFTVGDVVDLTVAHGSDSDCNLHFNGLQSLGTCPFIIQCGGAPLDQAYCYTDSDNSDWLFQSSDNSAIILNFSAGSIESATWDHLDIYDGVDETGTLVYSHTMFQQEFLSGVQAIGTTGSLYMKMSSDFSGSCASNTFAEWIWQVGCLDCTPSAATYTVVTDCDNFQYSVDVNITTLGSDATLDIINDGGASTVTATATGVYTVGPFTANIPVNLTLTNSDNSLCNVYSGELVNPLCPLDIVCGDPAVQETYCYVNDDVHAWHWHSTTPSVGLGIHFSSGTIQGNYGFPYGESLRIYDGPDNSSPLLYEQLDYNTIDLAGLQFISTQEDIYMEMTSDSYGSCDDGSTTPWEWEVSCADCSAPVATFTVVTDCDAYNYTVEVNITQMGTDDVIDITNDGGSATVQASAIGVYSVGPFTAGTVVNLTLVNDANSLCNVYSGELVNPLCPLDIVCGDPAVEETYCYGNYDVHAWHWHSTTPLVGLGIHFSSGTIQGNFGFPYGETLRIYDGPDNTSPLLYDQIGFNDVDLTGLQFISTQEDIYMELTSDGYGSCEDQSTTPWAFEVSCADCAAPVAAFSIETDCAAFTYTVQVDITEMGTDAVIDILNDGGAPPVPATAVGTYTVGPFTAGTTVNLTLVDDANSLCNLYSGPLVNPLCPTIVDCGVDTLQEIYCYPDYANKSWHWQSSGGQPLYMLFSAGTIESTYYDHLKVYDGGDEFAPLLYENLEPYPGTQLAGLLLIASGADLYMTFTSDGSGSCGGFGQSQWAWDVSCLDCTNPAATFSIVPDCLHHTYQVAVNVTNTGSDPTVRIASSTANDTIANVGMGITLSAPIPMDSTVMITVLNATNNLCRIFSEEFNSPSSDCNIPSCEVVSYDYCYTNADTAWYTYVGTSATEPLTIDFMSGQMLLNDYVEIFDGPNPQSPLLYIGNNGGNMAGISFNSTNPEHTITLRIISDGQYSCATGEATELLNWHVLCGYVGIGERTTTSFLMYPNPTTGMVDMVLPTSVKGAVDVRVMDIAGRTVHHETLNVDAAGNTLDLQGLQSGNYTVIITTADNTGAQRLQIVR
ncbi:MAG: T9SS type A sorting domain-containing protein [Flavobacteriales bacterium]